MTNMWMVRSGSNSFLINDFREYNLVAIGWNLGDLTNKSADEIYELFRKKYSNTRQAMQVVRFVHDIKIGDYVVTNNNENRTYLLGKITSDYYHSDKITKVDEANDNYWDVHDVEWLCEFSKDFLKKSTQGTLGTQTTVFNINDDAKEDILNYYNSYNTKINKIQTLTLSNQDPDCFTYEKTVEFLSNVLINERKCHFHYDRRRPVYFVKNTLVLFKYEGKLIAKGVLIDEFMKQEKVNGKYYKGYYLVDKDSIEIFNKPIDLKDIKKYVADIDSLNRDQKIDIKYLDDVNQMIKDFTGELKMENQYDVSACIIRKFLDENNFEMKFNGDNNLFSKFNELYSPEVLKSLKGVDVLNNIFPQKGNKSNLCYALEFSNEFKWLCGGIKGGSIFKFSLFKYGVTNKWTVGAAKSNLKTLTESEAIELAIKIRDAIVNGAEYIKNSDLETIEDYIKLEDELNRIFAESHEYCPINPTHSWIHKYYSIIFPDKIPIVHADGMKKGMIRKFRIEPEEGFYANDGQLQELAKKVGINLYFLFDERIVRLFFEGESIWDPIEKGHLVELDGCEKVKMLPINNKKRNLIYFGAPGTGKSFDLNKEKNSLLKNYPNNYERVTFHPDFSYANFCGTYKPVPENNSITYKYVPGPFMRILKKALKHPNEPYILIIEEINRANVAATFGDIFQLLDRDENNESQYPIDVSEDAKAYINEDKIKLPSNFFIWATMNSADQGVFPMDTAFKRRWEFKYFSINHEENKIENTSVILNNKKVMWNDLRKAINDELLSYKINEDKCLGPFFAFNEYHNKEIPTDVFKDIFKSKIIMYLFEDAARAKRNEMFSGAKSKNYVTYSEICDKFDEIGIEIFADGIKDKFITDAGE